MTDSSEEVIGSNAGSDSSISNMNVDVVINCSVSNNAVDVTTSSDLAFDESNAM